jgi:hypothetical protein
MTMDLDLETFLITLYVIVDDLYQRDTQRRYAEAEPRYKRVLAIREKVLGLEHPDVAVVLENYAALLQATNRNEEAKRLQNRAQKIRENPT